MASTSIWFAPIDKRKIAKRLPWFDASLGYSNANSSTSKTSMPGTRPSSP